MGKYRFFIIFLFFLCFVSSLSSFYCLYTYSRYSHSLYSIKENKKMPPTKSPFTVYIYSGGIKREVKTFKSKVKDVLRDEGISLSAKDRVIPHPDTEIFNKIFVKVIRVNTKILREKEYIDYNVVIKKDRSLPYYKKKVLKEGKKGIQDVKILVYYKNGKETLRKIISKKIIKKPQGKIIVKGSFFMLASRKHFRDFLIMKATAYAPFHCGGSKDGRTRTGVMAGRGIVAVDPKVIPMGTRLYIEGYGYAVAGDTGGDIKDMRIDLGVNTKREADRFGCKRIKVYILK